MTDREFLLTLTEKTPPLYLNTDDHDQLLHWVLDAVLGIDTRPSPPQTEESLQQIFNKLESILERGIRFDPPMAPDTPHFRGTPPLHSKAACLLNLLCFNESIPDRALVRISQLLWTIGSVEGTTEGARDLLLVGLYRRKRCLFRALHNLHDP